MLNEKAEKIKNVLFEKTEQNLEKYRDFHFGEFIEKPNQCGYFERNGNWYTYVIDERNFCTFTGPFNGSAIIYACSKVLHISKLFKEYKFTEQELKIYINKKIRINVVTSQSRFFINFRLIFFYNFQKESLENM